MFNNTQAVIWEENGKLEVEKLSEGCSWWRAVILDGKKELVDAQGESFEETLINLEENCTDFITENS